jgi:hypothetical protein
VAKTFCPYARFNFRNRPERVFGNQWLGIGGGFLQVGQGGVIAGVSQRNADISQKPAPFCP